MDGAPHVPDASDQQKFQHGLGYYASLFPSQNKKVKTVIMTFYLTIWTSIIGIASLHLEIQTLSELWDTVNSQLQEKMAEISLFHMCKGEKQTSKQTNIKMHSSTHILTPLPYLFFFLFLIQLLSPSYNYSSPLPGILFFSLWFFV